MRWPGTGVLALILAAPLAELGAGGGEPLSPVATDTWAAGASEYPEAAAELRRGDFPAAWARLAPLTEGETATARKARLVAGLYAHAAERTDLASEMLAGAAEPGGLLEDWRLFVLALSLSERSALPAARATLGELATRLPRSPLAPRALARTAEIAAEQGDLPGAEAAIAAVRERVLDPALRRQVERMAWDLATAHGLGELKREAARRLLVVDPVEASKLGAVELLRQPSGEVPWSSLFTADELRDRARNLLDAKLADGALATLAEVREADRDLAWALLEAEGLTRAGRAAEALAVLGRFPMPADARRLEVLWAAAEAGLEAAEARGGRTNLPSERRAALHEAALEDLERIADSGAPEPARRALLRLWQEHDLDHSYEKAMAVLERLRALDPEDTTGAEALWRLGWEELDGSDPRGAIAVWSRLETLYPGTRWARGGRYWSGVAHARLGDAGRARALWTSLTLADTEDFYSRHARSRLGADLPEPTLEAPTPLPWPNDPRLERARLLSDLGLDRLALDELDTQARAAEPRAVEALRALVHERMGDRRASIHALREVFHDLGGAHQAAVPGDARRMYYPLDYHDLVARHAERQGLSPFLVLAIIRQESAFDARAVSRSGARGLMQIVPATGRELALKAGLPYATERLLDPEFSIQLGSRYFRQVLDMFDGDVELALAGYNGGPYRIRSWWRTAGTGVGVDRFIDGLALEESRLYVHRILVFADSYQQLYGQRG